MGLRGKQQVVIHAVVFEHAGDLEAARQPVTHPLMRRHRSQIDAIQHQVSGVQRQHARNQIHQSSFARAIGANQRMDLARPDREIYLVNGDQAAEVFAQVFGNEQTHADFPR